MNQGSVTVEVYCTKLKTVWQELRNVSPSDPVALIAAAAREPLKDTANEKLWRKGTQCPVCKIRSQSNFLTSLNTHQFTPKIVGREFHVG